MRKIFAIALLAILIGSCKEEQKEVGKVEMVKSYIDALNESNYNAVVSMFADSIRLNELVYKSTFSKEQYGNLFQWDSVFKPRYKILEIQLKEGVVEMRVSKQCKRIHFLNGEPIITREQVKFDANNIHSIDIVEYVVFNDSLWTKNRAELVSWTSNNHPELDNFLFDQSLEGGVKFKEAIDRYQQAHPQEESYRKL
ncbi:hypothetical protein [Flagellimonas myxillae]|uniref:hypothetical protein n=1 Tax=Flagellimonas myxillae TaxID=2942214 RepID=UPI00201F28FC|nr:hypothetical protein [Muricauda myxillae]MCL6267244.1 hypothetical protein [Muricauda myxillae]